eukprot:COSAG02_NODE_4341_length_5478_cov_14.459007_2_plen_338_part_00
MGIDRAGARCFLPRFDDLVDDAVLFATARIATKAQPRARLFIWGESMGGGLGFLVAQRLAVTGCILVAPMCKLQPGMQPGPVLTALYTAVARLVPRRFMPGGGRRGQGAQHSRRIATTARALSVPARAARNGLPQARSTPEYSEQGFQLPAPPAGGAVERSGGDHNDNEKALEECSVWERQQYDLLRYQGGLRFGTALSILRTTQRIYGELEKLQCPVLLMGGQEDPTCSPTAVRELYQRAATIDKEIVQYDGMGHIIMFTQGEHAEKSRDVVTRMQHWLSAHNRGAPTMWRHSTPPAPRPRWAVARRRTETVHVGMLVVLAAALAWVLRRRRGTRL